MNSRKIKNKTARFWKKSELNQTVKECKAAGFEVERKDDTTTITNPENGDVVLMSLYTGQVEMVLFDKSYFEN